MSFSSTVKHGNGKTETHLSNGKLNLADIVCESREMCIKKDVLCVLEEDLICPVEVIVYTVPMTLKNANSRLTMESYLLRVEAAKKKREASIAAANSNHSNQNGNANRNGNNNTGSNSNSNNTSDSNNENENGNGQEEDESTKKLQRRKPPQLENTSRSLPRASVIECQDSPNSPTPVGRGFTVEPISSPSFQALQTPDTFAQSSHLRAMALISAASKTISSDDNEAGCDLSQEDSPQEMSQPSSFAELAKIRSQQSQSGQTSPLPQDPHSFSLSMPNSSPMSTYFSVGTNRPALSAAASRRRAPSAAIGTTNLDMSTITSKPSESPEPSNESQQDVTPLPPPPQSRESENSTNFLDFFDDLPTHDQEKVESGSADETSLPKTSPQDKSTESQAMVKLLNENADLRNQMRSMQIRHQVEIQHLRDVLAQTRRELEGMQTVNRSTLPYDPFSSMDGFEDSSEDTHDHADSNNPFY